MLYNIIMAEHNLIFLNDETPVRLTPNGTHSGMDITIQNVSESATVYLGSNDQLSDESYGFRLTLGSAWSIELHGKDAIYAIASNSNGAVAVFKGNLESGS
jgi:hypothetical protein